MTGPHSDRVDTDAKRRVAVAQHERRMRGKRRRRLQRRCFWTRPYGHKYQPASSLKDCEVQTFRAGGKGGQKQNKTSSGVRVIHHPSGARGESREERSQTQNKRAAFVRMAKSTEFQRWVRLEHAKRVGALDAWVADQMRPENLLIEYGESFA